MRKFFHISGLYGTDSRTSGFTLIELMVVVIIIAALASMVLPRLLPVADEAKSKIAEGDIANLTTALKLYYLRNDSVFPAKIGDLYPEYIEKRPLDPWKREYQYREPGGSGRPFDVWSMGVDGRSGTEDDITSWEE